jgi:acyl-homoserine-lactone acylase
MGLKHARLLIGLAATTLIVANAQPSPRSSGPELWREVEVIRTAHGVPHIRATNMRAAGYALAWIQLEDYGPGTAMNLLRSSGRRGLLYGRDSMESDFAARRARERAVETFHLLDQETRDVYEGFAIGVNRWVELHPADFAPGMFRDFTGHDAAAMDVGRASTALPRWLANRAPGGRGGRGGSPPLEIEPERTPRDQDVGSNAWALAPSRTKSKKAILLRNPHLTWTAGYYEAHMTVPGVVDFYGDFRIGSAFAVIGGFNKDLGFSTTNNAQDLDEIYELQEDSARADHYLFDGTSIPITKRSTTVDYRTPTGFSSETRDTWTTPLGPVLLRANGKVYVNHAATDGEFRAGEQFLRMMRATSLAEYKDAMRIRARATSHFTYADRAGNIYYLWNAALPNLPHPTGGDTGAVAARTSRDIWTRYVPYDSLPQVLNPKGGYIHNENDSHHFTNIREKVDTINRYPGFEQPHLLLRSQLAIELIGGNNKFSLEDVVKAKHSYKMLLADRVKPDLIAAVKATKPTGDVAAALAMMTKWDNTSAPDSKGGTLFEIWWGRYSQGLADSVRYAKVWSAADPVRTPRGLGNPTRAAEAFAWAVPETIRRYGKFDIAWGDIHRVRRGNVDVPVGGCSGALGCFRVLTFRAEPDGKLAATGSDGWILAVEFGDVPRAYSVLAYGQSPNTASPWHADQAEMFAKGQMKKVAFLEKDILANVVARYRPGER